MNGKGIRVGLALLAALAVLIVLQPPALADLSTLGPGLTTVNMKLNGTSGNISGTSYGADPYSVIVNGATVNLWCNDVFDDMQIGNTWTAQVFNGSNSELTKTDFIGYLGDDADFTSTSTIDNAYEEAAWLLLNWSSANSSVYTEALWKIFDSGFAPPYNATAVTSLISTASANATSSLLSDLTIYDPITYIGGSTISGSEAQQFIALTHVSEASSLAVLAFDLFAILGGIFLVRKRILG